MLSCLFLFLRQSLCKIHLNPEVLPSPHSQASLFYVDLVPSMPYLIAMDLLASWRICDGNTLTSLIFPGTCSVSWAVITRWDLAQRDQMTQVFLVQVARLTWLPTGCLTLAMCPTVEAGDLVCLYDNRVPDRNMSDNSSNILYSCNASSKLS